MKKRTQSHQLTERATISAQISPRNPSLKRKRPNTNRSFHKSPKKSSRSHYKTKISKINKIFKEVAPEISKPHNVASEDNMYDYVLHTLEYIVTKWKLKDDARVLQEKDRQQKTDRPVRSDVGVDLNMFDSQRKAFKIELEQFQRQKRTVETSQAQVEKDQSIVNTQLQIVETKLSEFNALKSKFNKKYALQREQLKNKEQQLNQKEQSVAQRERGVQLAKDKIEREIDSKRRELDSQEVQMARQIEQLQHSIEEQSTSILSSSSIEEIEIDNCSHLTGTQEWNIMYYEDMLSTAVRLDEFQQFLFSKEVSLSETEAQIAMDKQEIANAFSLIDSENTDLAFAKTDLEAQQAKIQEKESVFKNEKVAMKAEIDTDRQYMKQLYMEIESQRKELEHAWAKNQETEVRLSARFKSLQEYEASLENMDKLIVQEFDIVDQSTARSEKRKDSDEERQLPSFTPSVPVLNVSKFS